MSNLVWEEEFTPIFEKQEGQPHQEWHLKKLIPHPQKPTNYKISVAWIYQAGKRKYQARVLNPDTTFIVQQQPFFDHNFRSLKQAKAWCLATYILGK